MPAPPSPREIEIEVLDGGLEVVPGLKTSGIAAGIKPDGKLDLGVIVADAPCNIAGVFTQNQAAAAPILLCKELLAKQRICRAVVVNSGNANALTGAQGDEDARAVAEAAEAHFGGPVLPLSTGVIGVPLPRERIISGLAGCKAQLGADTTSFAQAILTTDTCTKQAARRVRLADGDWAYVGGVAKGSGMIHPNMATMLAFLATDAPVSSAALDGVLRRITATTFNQISVDGDTSTNDAVLALAPTDPQGELHDGSPQVRDLEEAFRQVAADLAEQIVADGEGATKVLQLRVHGARWPGDARAIARAIIASPLVKTALHGGDANWGRIIAAAGNAGVEFDLDALELRLGGHLVFTDGHPQLDEQELAERCFKDDRVRAELKVGDGGAEVTVLTSDLSADYVSINANYRT